MHGGIIRHEVAEMILVGVPRIADTVDAARDQSREIDIQEQNLERHINKYVLQSREQKTYKPRVRGGGPLLNSKKANVIRRPDGVKNDKGPSHCLLHAFDWVHLGLEHKSVLKVDVPFNFAQLWG